jgi:hypothetical protein
MSEILNEFKGLFVSCSGKWDKNTNSFYKYTDKEKYNCCIDQYKPARDYCLEQCSKTYKDLTTNCESICHDTYKLGIDTCKLMDYVPTKYRENFYIPIKMGSDNGNITVAILFLIIVMLFGIGLIVWLKKLRK